jgi:hypothetical protein
VVATAEHGHVDTLDHAHHDLLHRLARVVLEERTVAELF